VVAEQKLRDKIKALEDAGLDATDEIAELAKLPAGKPAKVVAKVSGATEAVEFDIEVDVDSFESGGQAFGAPIEPGIYQGVFQDIITPTTKPEQRWFIFKTDDPRVEKQLGRQVRSALIVSPLGGGAFKLGDILDGLNLPYTLDGNHVKGSIPKGLACSLEYQERTLEGKTQNRLQNVYAAGTVETAI